MPYNGSFWQQLNFRSINQWKENLLVYDSWAAVKGITSFHLFFSVDILKGCDFPQNSHADKGSQCTVVIRLIYGMLLGERKKLSVPIQQKKMHKCCSLQVRYKLKITVNHLYLVDVLSLPMFIYLVGQNKVLVTFNLSFT